MVELGELGGDSATRHLPRGVRPALLLLIFAASWELIGRSNLAPGGTFPPPSGIAIQLWADRDLYPLHLASTLKTAALGFLAGNVFATALAFLFTLVPPAERLLRGFLVAVFSIPLIVIAPLVGLTFGGQMPQIVLASLAVYFPTLVSVQLGLSSVDAAIVDTARAVGAGRWAIFRKIRIRSSLPGLMAGLRVAAPWAILGAMLAEFLGARWGLGIFMLGSMGQAVPERLWGIGFVATGVAALAYWLFGVLGSWLTRTGIDTSYAAGNSPVDLAVPDAANNTYLTAFSRAVLSVGATLFLWEILVRASGLPRIIAKGPIDVVRFLFLQPESGERLLTIGNALAETLPPMALGLGCGLATAFSLAVLLSLWPLAARSLLPFALLSQTMPLVALTPLVVLVFGRGTLSIVVVTVAVTFFPSFVTIRQGLAAIPSTTVDLLRAYRASAITSLWKVSIPSALPHLLAAARLAAPRALLGVMLAEYLATGTGLGFLLADARGRLNFRMMWAIAVITALISILLYLLANSAERRLLRRFGSTLSDA